jgi:hypothetical protein
MIGKNAAKLDLPAAYGRLHLVFHVSLLREFHDSPGALRPPPDPIVVDGEPWYTVEKVLSHRTRKSGRKTIHEYLVQWEGYDATHNSWEPEENLTSDLVQAFKSQAG